MLKSMRTIRRGWGAHETRMRKDVCGWKITARRGGGEAEMVRVWRYKFNRRYRSRLLFENKVLLRHLSPTPFIYGTLRFLELS